MEKSRNITGKNRRPPTIFPPHTPLYFDYNATTPVDSLVSSAMMPYITSMWGNPSSSHYYGKGPKQAVEAVLKRGATTAPVRIEYLSEPCWPQTPHLNPSGAGAPSSAS